MSLIDRHDPRLGRTALATGLACALLLGLTGCPPDTLSEQTPDAGLTDPGLDPESLFDSEVKPQMTMSCSCHGIVQGTVSPFLAAGMEYQSITGYSGGKFLTPVPDNSLLLQKGQHTGPALTVDQATAVRGWLSAEAATRGNGMSSATTPTVPLRLGDFFLSLQSLTQDPQASITFSLAQIAGSTTYRISNMMLNAGPTGGIEIKHPRFIIFTASGATPEASDALGTVDLTVSAGMSGTVGSGSLLLPNLPASSARIALAFQVISVVNPTMAVLACKNLAGFTANVQPQLKVCASICHSASGTDTRHTQATNAFNMASATSTDPMAVGTLCVSTLARIDKVNPPASILVVQPEPQTMGGTPNHPYKITDPTSFSAYQSAVVTWAAGEK